MAENLTGKVALVTGGAVRVGKAITLALAEAGCDVCIHYGHSQEDALQTRAEAEAQGVAAHLFQADLRQVEAAQQLMTEVVAAMGRVDFLINNAALFLEGGLAETTAGMWEEQFALNLRAPFFLSQQFARHLPPTAEGAIVNVGDARVLRAGTDHFAYRLTKSALLAMTENLALELAPRIRVNAVALGAILPPPGADQNYLERLAQQRVPLQRSGDATIVAENVLHLLEQPFLTGVILKVDGGEFLGSDKE